MIPVGLASEKIPIYPDVSVFFIRMSERIGFEHVPLSQSLQVAVSASVQAKGTFGCMMGGLNWLQNEK